MVSGDWPSECGWATVAAAGMRSALLAVATRCEWRPPRALVAGTIRVDGHDCVQRTVSLVDPLQMGFQDFDRAYLARGQPSRQLSNGEVAQSASYA